MLSHLSGGHLRLSTGGTYCQVSARGHALPYPRLRGVQPVSDIPSIYRQSVDCRSKVCGEVGSRRASTLLRPPFTTDCAGTLDNASLITRCVVIRRATTADAAAEDAALACLQALWGAARNEAICFCCGSGKGILDFSLLGSFALLTFSLLGLGPRVSDLLLSCSSVPSTHCIPIYTLM